MASWIRISYPIRLFLWLLAYSVLLGGCFIAFLSHREKQFKAEEMNSRMQLINTYILNEMHSGKDVSDISLDDFVTLKNLRVSVIDIHGRIVYDNTLDSLPGSNHLDREEISKAVSHGSGFTVRRHSQSTGDYYFYSATRDSGDLIVRTAVPYSVSLISSLKADYTFLWIMGLVAVVMCVLGYFATRRIGRHLTRLNRFAENVERGETISDTEPFPDDEFGSISNHIVYLYARLQKALADRDAEHRAAMREQTEKERIKKQLTNNINHELKTPVASIRLCLETIISHPTLTDEQRMTFLQRSLANTDRLQRLLGDVSLITRMDDGCSSIVREPIDVAEIIATSVEERRLLARSKGISINCNINGPLPAIGNGHLLESIFNNLIDNAIVYSGGTMINISLEAVTESRLSFSVSDNGSGIPDEHLPHIFERFYRIDKGRSRAAGGTGLGLSIVKNAVGFHGGMITVRNSASGGLVFHFSICR